MVVHQRVKEIVTLKNTDKRTEPFTYPLFYPKGTFGYSVDLKLQQPYPSRQHLTRLEMAQYRIAYRKGLTKNLPLEKDRSDLDLRETQFNALHFGGRLFQQYLVDTFIRVERDRIQWIKSNQKKILAEKYIGVSNFLKELAEKKDAVVGETIILPSSFPGSTQYYAEQFEDAMAIVRRFGSPDFFITMTCIPEWPEIKEAARIVTEEGFVIQQRAQDRPDLVARVAKLKFETIIEELSEDKVHNPDELDDLISAEIPDNTDPELRELVLKWMIHNPCGEHDLNASCMKNHNGKIHCRFDFPKPFQETTSLVDDEKPKLRRRYDSRLDQQSPEFSHELAVYRKDKSGRRITRDNRHVASYNTYLLKLFNCHINVEFVGSIRAVKYLYKYIYKGHDCAYIKIVEEQKRINYNEPDTYIEGRCITPPEACWRLSGNELQKKSHVVQRLDIYLPGHYRMSDTVNVQEDLADTGIKGSTLESYFKTNATKKQKEEANRLSGLDEEITYHFYWQMPEHFKWIGRQSEWVERLRQINVIGRIHSVNFVAQPELYHLRMLLYHVNDATSFDELLKFNGIRHATFKQACLARGLTYDDQQWIDGLQESAMSKTPRAMRTLFTQILIFGSPENPKRLWEMFKADLAEDFLLEIERTGGRVEDAINHTYRIIASKLNTEATEGRDFQYWVNNFDMDNIDFVNNHLNVDMLNNDCSILEGEWLYGLLKGKQLDIVNTILDAVTSHNSGPRCFFIDGPGESKEENNEADPAKVPRLSLVLHDQDSTSINCQSPVTHQPSTSINCQSPVTHQPSILINCQSPVTHQPSTSINCQSPVTNQPSTSINCQSPVTHQPSISINCQSLVTHQSSTTTNPREASTRANAVIRNIVKLESSEKHLRKLEEMRLRASRRLKVETCTQYSQRLEDLRFRASMEKFNADSISPNLSKKQLHWLMTKNQN
uniref:Helitron helicase-like domain-containing protein n=1 Tax=Biomphalaria glabrata TaxID=6526 RepID=A0A2C9KDP4_BIOGL